MLVVIALAVFVIFLVLGFMTGGWSYFAGLFGGAVKGGSSGQDAARIKCQTVCASYASSGSPQISLTSTDYWGDRILGTKHDVDLDGDGQTDYYCCRGDLDVNRIYCNLTTTANRNVVPASDCPINVG